MELFVFPLGHFVFYPHTSKPLNIFEPRYLQMVKESIASGTAIGIGFVDEPDRPYQYHFGQPLTFVRSVVGIGHPVILETRGDGSLLVLMQGFAKARLGNVVNKGTPYIVCEAEKLEENNTVNPENLPSYMVLEKIMFNWLKNQFPDAQQREVFMRNLKSPHEVLAAFSAYLVSDRDMQQFILEISDINSKIEALIKLSPTKEILS